MSEAEYLDSIYPYTEEYISELRKFRTIEKLKILKGRL